MSKPILILVDIQYDFLPGGSLAVPQGDLVIPVVNRMLETPGMLGGAIATQDWHPAGHGSFASTHRAQPFTMGTLAGRPQVLWPDHCVVGTRGAEITNALGFRHIQQVIQKGQRQDVDSYSGFADNDADRSQGLKRGAFMGTGLDEALQRIGAKDVWIAGLATDYCVAATAIDAAQLGYRTTCILDACRGVEARPGDIDAAIQRMEQAGVRFRRMGSPQAANGQPCMAGNR